jgi:hypothetical protein
LLCKAEGASDELDELKLEELLELLELNELRELEDDKLVFEPEEVEELEVLEISSALRFSPSGAPGNVEFDSVNRSELVATFTSENSG